jgi:HSP20 family protein
MTKRRPSIFDAFEDLSRGFPSGRDLEDWFQEPFEDMINSFEKSVPPEFRDLVKENRTPTGVVRRYGPFVYGFSHTAEPGKEPIFQEFGNVRPTVRGIEPSVGREPLVDIMEENESYKIYIELPGVDKEKSNWMSQKTASNSQRKTIGNFTK